MILVLIKFSFSPGEVGRNKKARKEGAVITIAETGVRSLGWEDPLEKGMATHSSILVFLPGEFHGQRSLVGYSPWGRRAGHD